MNETPDNQTSRREFLKTTGRIAAVSALAGVAIPHVHAAEDNTIQVALIGCGGRGGGAAKNALSVETGPMRLVAMADVFENKLKTSYNSLKGDEKVGSMVDVRRTVDSSGSTVTEGDGLPEAGTSRSLPHRSRFVGCIYAIERGSTSSWKNR
jgi:hypothetical protein